jgi:hypothetical protein
MPSKKKVQSKASRPTKQQTRESKEKDTCFIIMPFGDWFDYYYETIYVPAIDASGLEPRRADDLYRPSAIVHDIWALTQRAKIILADLSGKNPNVFYELGLAHAVAKPAILVTESIEDVPFDLRSLRVLVYDKNEPEWGKRLRDKIETSIKEILASPLESVLPTFLKVKKLTSSKTVTKAEKELISMRQDIDFLKREVQARAQTSSPPAKQRMDAGDAYMLAMSLMESGASIASIRRRLLRGNLPEHIVNDIIAAAYDDFTYRKERMRSDSTDKENTEAGSE